MTSIFTNGNLMDNQILFTLIGFHSLVAFLPVSVFLLYKWPRMWHHLLALFLGFLAGFLDSNSDDPQFAVLLLLVFGFFLGFAQSERPWRWALMLGMWVPVFQFFRVAIENTGTQLVLEVVFSLAVFVPAFLGTYWGSAVRLAVARSQKPSEETRI